MFCSRLDNFFPDGSPAPLYFVYHYLTKYDSISQTFTRDVNIPSFDGFDVDPVNLPMYYTSVDTSILRKSMGDKFRKVVEAQVYLSENTWKHSVLAPASVFAIQTIPVEKDFQKTFLSAYKVTSYVSDLNNAYFVYNISASPSLIKLQEKRNEELRSIKGFSTVDKKFLDYYTAFPSGGIYDSITKLALSLTTKNSRPIDRVMAVRDLFLKRNENGERVFRYSLQAGAVDDPNIPSSKMLYNFLFKTHTGYCTYYAGASLFMLRALGVPTRFTTGFAAINRSDKNKGWYWFYASQAHAWTQVYFPEYGWIDFDMTIGNEDQHEAPKPDGTPPLPPPDPLYVLNAKAESVDVKNKKLVASFKELIYLNSVYTLSKTFTRPFDASLSRVLFNKKDTSFSAIHAGDSMIIIAYKDDSKVNPKPKPGLSVENIMEGLPSPYIADEIHLRGSEKEKPKENSKKPGETNEKKVTWQQVAKAVAFGLAGLIVLVLLVPALYLLYRVTRIAVAKNSASKADQVYRAALYRFHMTGLERENQTPLEYARVNVDPVLHAGFEEFMLIYLRLKYTNAPVSPEHEEIINRFAKGVGPAIRRSNGIFRRVFNYFNLLLALRYFQQPQKTDYETSTL
jgi:protein-glutamine gamma-glutamyltransferase